MDHILPVVVEYLFALRQAWERDEPVAMKFEHLISKKKVVFFDGAMGTELARRGLDTGGLLSLTAPEQIFAFHREYADLGVDCLTSNTFTANRIYMETHGLKADLEKLNTTGIDLARRAVLQDQLVFGDIGPTGKLLHPYGDCSEEEFIDNYREQAAVLSGAGADGLIIETMTDLREASCALIGCRKETDLPVLVTLSFATIEKGGRTIMGNSVSEAVKALESEGATAVGANCGNLTPLEMAELASMFCEQCSLPVIIQPNAGLPKLKMGKTVYDMSPRDFAMGLKACAGKGASIVGGCCGTTLNHIREAKEMLEGFSELP